MCPLRGTPTPLLRWPSASICVARLVCDPASPLENGAVAGPVSLAWPPSPRERPRESRSFWRFPSQVEEDGSPQLPWAFSSVNFSQRPSSSSPRPGPSPRHAGSYRPPPGGQGAGGTGLGLRPSPPFIVRGHAEPHKEGRPVTCVRYEKPARRRPARVGRACRWHTCGGAAER